MAPQITILKRKLKGFFKKESLDVVKNAVNDVNEIISKASMLVRGFYLDWLNDVEKDESIEALKIDEELIRIACLVVQGDTKLSVRKPRSSKEIIEDNPGKKEEKEKHQANRLESRERAKALNQTNFERLLKVFNDLFKDDDIVKTDLSLSHTLCYSYSNLVTAYENNVTLHFLKYPKKFIKCTLMSQGICSKDARKIAAIITNYYYYVEMSDGSTMDIDDKMSNVLQQHDPERNFRHLFPVFRNTVQSKKDTINEDKGSKSDKEPHPRCYEIKSHPWDYLLTMVKINQMLETSFPNLDRKYTKLFNPLPFHSSSIPMHIRIDTSGLGQLFMTQEKIKQFKEYYACIHPEEKPLNMKNKIDMLSSFKKLHGREAKDRSEEGEYATELWSFITNLKKCRQYKEISKLCIKNHQMVFDNSILTDGVSISFQMIEKSSFGRKERFKKKK